MIRYERQPSLVATRISVALFETIDSSFVYLFTNSLDFTAVQYEWENVRSGNYTAYLYISRLECDLMCINDTVNKCTICPSTKLHFMVEEDKIRVLDSAHGLLSNGICIIGLFLLFEIF